MVDLLVLRSRRLHEPSPVSVELSPRKCKRNSISSFESIQAKATKKNPSLRVSIIGEDPSLSHSLDRNVCVLSGVLFQLEDQVEVEDVPDSSRTLSGPLPLNFLTLYHN